MTAPLTDTVALESPAPSTPNWPRICVPASGRPRRPRSGSIQPLRPEDIADAVAYIVTRDRRVAVNEILVRASEQTW